MWSQKSQQKTQKIFRPWKFSVLCDYIAEHCQTIFKYYFQFLKNFAEFFPNRKNSFNDDLGGGYMTACAVFRAVV